MVKKDGSKSLRERWKSTLCTLLGRTKRSGRSDSNTLRLSGATTNHSTSPRNSPTDPRPRSNHSDSENDLGGPDIEQTASSTRVVNQIVQSESTNEGNNSGNSNGQATNAEIDSAIGDSLETPLDCNSDHAFSDHFKEFDGLQFKGKGKEVASEEDDRISTTSPISTSSIKSLVYSDGPIDPELQEYLTDHRHKRNIRALSKSYILKPSHLESDSRPRLRIDTNMTDMATRRVSFRSGDRFGGRYNLEITGNSENQSFRSDEQFEQSTPGSTRRVSVFFEELGPDRYNEPYPFTPWPRAMRTSSAAGIADLDPSDGVNDSEPRLEESDIFPMDDLINNLRHSIHASYVKAQEEKSKAVTEKGKAKSNRVANGGCLSKLDRIGRHESGDDDDDDDDNDPGAQYNRSNGLNYTRSQNFAPFYAAAGTGGGGDGCQDAEVTESVDVDGSFKLEEGFETFSLPSYGYPTPPIRQYGTDFDAFTWSPPTERTPPSLPFPSPAGNFKSLRLSRTSKKASARALADALNDFTLTKSTVEDWIDLKHRKTRAAYAEALKKGLAVDVGDDLTVSVRSNRLNHSGGVNRPGEMNNSVTVTVKEV